MAARVARIRLSFLHAPKPRRRVARPIGQAYEPEAVLVVGRTGVSRAACLGALRDRGRPKRADGCVRIHQVWNPRVDDRVSGIRSLRRFVPAGRCFWRGLTVAGSRSPYEREGPRDRSARDAPVAGHPGLCAHALSGLTSACRGRRTVEGPNRRGLRGRSACRRRSSRERKANGYRVAPLRPIRVGTSTQVSIGVSRVTGP